MVTSSTGRRPMLPSTPAMPPTRWPRRRTPPRVTRVAACWPPTRTSISAASRTAPDGWSRPRPGRGATRDGALGMSAPPAAIRPGAGQALRALALPPRRSSRSASDGSGSRPPTRCRRRPRMRSPSAWRTPPAIPRSSPTSWLPGGGERVRGGAAQGRAADLRRRDVRSGLRDRAARLGSPVLVAVDSADRFLRAARCSATRPELPSPNRRAPRADSPPSPAAWAGRWPSSATLRPHSSPCSTCSATACPPRGGGRDLLRAGVGRRGQGAVAAHLSLPGDRRARKPRWLGGRRGGGQRLLPHRRR